MQQQRAEENATVDYTPQPGAQCPSPQGISPQALQEFNRYANDPLMMQFYKYYVKQQNDLAAFQQHNPNTPNCPPAFWVQDSVAATFQKLPENDVLRQFFVSYVNQQRAIDAYYYSPSQSVNPNK